jgi:hypothetical protein
VLRIAIAPKSHVGGPPTRSGHKQSHISTFSTSRHALVVCWSLDYLEVSNNNFRNAFVRREIGNLILAVSYPPTADYAVRCGAEGRTTQTVVVVSSRLPDWADYVATTVRSRVKPYSMCYDATRANHLMALGNLMRAVHARSRLLLEAHPCTRDQVPSKKR